MVSNAYDKLKETISSNYSGYDDSDPLEFIKKLNYNKDEKLIKIADEFLNYDFDGQDVINVKIKNRVLNELETFQNKSVLQSKPRDLQVVLTNKCNLRCKMCVNDKIDWELSSVTLNSIKDNMKYFERILWQGGEAFLYPDFLSLLELAHKNKVVQSIMTNALLIDEQTADVITKTDTDIVISIDSVNPEIYSYIRSGAKFEQLINSLELLNKYKKINNSKTSFDMATIIMHSTCRELFEFIDFAEKYNFRSICLNQVGMNDKDQDENLTDEDIVFLRSNKLNLINRIKNSPVRFEMNLSCFFEAPKDNHHKEEEPKQENKKQKEKTDKCASKEKLYCQRPWNSIYIEYKGFFMPTCKCFGGNMEYIDNKTIEEVWNSDVFVNYRKQIGENKFSECCSNLCVHTKHDNWRYK